MEAVKEDRGGRRAGGARPRVREIELWYEAHRAESGQQFPSWKGLDKRRRALVRARYAELHR